MPVIPFPDWLRCTACDELAPDRRRASFGFVNDKPAPPARGEVLPRRLPASAAAGRSRSPPGSCSPAGRAPGRLPLPRLRPPGRRLPEASHPRLRMDDHGGNLGRQRRDPLHELRRQAQHPRGHRASAGEQNLPALPGPPPAPGHVRPDRLHAAAEGAGRRRVQPVVRPDAVRAGGAADRGQRAAGEGGAALGAPAGRASARVLRVRAGAVPQLRGTATSGPRTSFRAAIEQHRKELAAATGRGDSGYPDLRTPEWEVFSAAGCRRADRRLHPPPRPGGVPAALAGLLRRRRPGRAAARGARAGRVHPAGRPRPRRPRPGDARAAVPGPPDLGAGQRGPRRRASSCACPSIC